MDRIPADVPRAPRKADELRRTGVELVEVSFVDNAGITRVKTVPLARLPFVASAGVGASMCFETFDSADAMHRGRYLGGPDGDLRLVPDIERVVALSAQPGWAWAPADKFRQEGGRFAACQRGFAQRQVAAAHRMGLDVRMAVEHEWILGVGATDEFVPAFDGPGYGQIRLEQVAGYAAELVADLQAQGLVVEQFHPEYAQSQVEVSVAAADPVKAADDAVLVRHTVRALSLRHGWRATFAPSVNPDGAGSGAHLHLSVHDELGNAMTGGDGESGMRPVGEAFLAGVLRELPALVAVGAGHPASFLRLQPSRWAGIWRCWGHETREAAIRAITGVAGTESWAANAEIKCFDATANPYLLVGSVLAAGLAGVAGELRLPEPVTGDPAMADEGQGVPRLPTSAAEAADAFAASDVLGEAMGPELHDSVCTVRRADVQRCARFDPHELSSDVRWRW